MPTRHGSSSGRPCTQWKGVELGIPLAARLCLTDEQCSVLCPGSVKGTHTGAPYSPLPGVPAVSTKSPPVACQNDPEKITAYFKTGSKSIERIVVEAKPGGRGFSGPVGFYLQAGGDPSKLPKL